MIQDVELDTERMDDDSADSDMEVLVRARSKKPVERETPVTSN